MPSRRVLGLRGARPAPPGGFTPVDLAPAPGRMRVVLSVAPVRFGRPAARAVPMRAVLVPTAHPAAPMGGVLAPTARRVAPMGGVRVPMGRRVVPGGSGVVSVRSAVALRGETLGAIACRTARAGGFATLMPTTTGSAA